MKHELTVGITTHGRRCEWLRDMLNGLYYFTQAEFKVIIVDNLSEDNTLDYLGKLAEIKNIEIIKNKENVDDTRGMNQILSVVDSKYLLKIDSDTLFTQKAPVDAILKQMEDTRVSLIGPYWDLSLRRRKEIVEWGHSSGMKNKFDQADQLVKTINSHFEVTTRLPRGNFMLMQVADIRKVGCFDVRYLHNAMEYSLAMRLLEAGLDYAEFLDESVIHRPSDDIRLRARAQLPDLLGEKL
ncbi:MAG: Glycosyltransferase [Candidatus Giovannonibacteria bacterium GW2011_GWA2_44_26]|uniref:Glycosyltransferase n=1 Tax=Candidatus Giovannonibacteria bacterium GW2011_GWA2_44_26 TaxID=1618648 RepID=A0A0G1IQA3_9BACT|nr:MAG: Glycosyltransferase [Candidatus Giovannonibacteria bacterium GW2011_GWA2_44_26]